MADNYKDTGKMTEKQKVQEITEKLEQGIREVFESEKYKAYLNTMSKFHTYSFNNTMLIAMQKPDATLVAGYQAWQKNFDRHVKRGEKGIRILAPTFYKMKEEQEKTDPETGEIILDKNGMPVMEEVEVKIPSFRVVPVFDLSQTEGKELPDIGVSELSGGVKDYEEFMQALMEASPVPVGYEQIEGDSKGYFHTSEHRIAIQEGMSQSQTVKTAVHEVAHAKLHDRDLNSELEETMSKDRSTKEVEAESVAYTVCQHFGIDTSDYSFGYIAGWSSGKDMRELKSSLDTIRKTASELITDISGRLQELKRDRVEEQELSAMQKAEKLIGELEQEKTIFTDEERNLIVNYMYKFDDMDKTRELAEKLAYMIENEPVNEALTVIDAQAEIDRLPDGMVGLSEMHQYGYMWNEMLPLTQERAMELFDHDLPVYRLYEDGSEATIKDRAEVMEHSGMFGIEKAEWEQYVELQSMRGELAESFEDRETQLLQGNENQFGIYQLKDSPQTEEVRFMNADFWEMKGIAIAKEHYQLVYAAPLENGMTLEDIFTKFNIDRPADFKGHSLSVSDVVVLHQNGKNTSHFVDSFGYKEVPEFLQVQERTEELQMEKAEEQKETTQEMIAESEERENAVFLVNYGEWKEVSELDLEQNYFAIDDPYGDGDFRIYWLQNEIKDITPAGAVYYTPEEAAQEIANLPYNKENNIGSYMVNGKAQLERIMEERSLQKHLDMENDRVSYYVIADISTWAENRPEKSKLERFDSFTEALEQFQTYRKKDGQFHDDKARTTFGVNVHGIEFDVIHARNNENVLSLDFTHSSEALQSQHFMDDLQILCNELVDKVRVHREMTPEEVKQFVKERLEYQLHSSGLEEISVYMNRFDTLYEQGKMEHLMPTANQKHIVEDIPLAEWENEYISIHNRYADLAEKELSVVEYEMLLGMEPAQVSVDGLMEMMNSRGELWNYPMEEKEHCLQENIPVVTVRDGEEARYFEIPEELIAKARESEFRGYEPEEMAFSVGDRFVSIQNCTDGYDYSIFLADYTLLDGGVYDNPDISIHAALKDILEDMGVSEQEKLIPVDYEELMEKTEAAEQAKIQEAVQAKQTVSDFKAKTNEMFHEIGGLNAEDMEMTAMAHILSKIDEYDIDVEIVDLAVTGSRCRGLEQEGSDIDIVVEYKGREHEDDLFNAFNEYGLKIGGVRVDINPITEGKTGTLATYLPGVESYLEEKRAAMENAEAEAEKTSEKTITLTVAECGEFHNLGEYHENIKSVEEAIDIFNQIPSEKRNMIPSIGISIHTEGKEAYEDVQMDIISGRVADLEMLEYVPDITDDPKAVALIQELVDKLPDIEVRGSLEKWQAAFLAAEIDELSYDYDPYQYKDTVEDREAQVANIAEDIRSGNTEYLNDFLNAIISEEIRESVADIFGQGTDLDDSEAVQTARKAKELLDRLAEYKPLAKIEELEEQNYNMVDNVLNNGAEKKENEQSKGRISIREKLAEKKAVIEKRDKADRNCPEKDTEKKVHREM